MNKATLALKLAELLDIPKKQGEDFVAAFQDIVTKALENDEEVTIAGFGTFSSRIRAARKGVNPRNPSQKIDIPAVKVPKFKAGKALKDALKASMNKAPVENKVADDHGSSIADGSAQIHSGAQEEIYKAEDAARDDQPMM